MNGTERNQSPVGARKAPVAILGVPFDNVTMAETIELIAEMVASRQPHYLATANVDFVVQASADIELRRILFDSHLVLCDGMPLVWASKQLGNPLPERVTGSDLVPRLLAESERRGWRVYFLGGTEESVAQAAAKTLEKHPRLNLVGAYSPPFRPLLEMDHSDILRRVTNAAPDILLVAFGCPKQEKWINMHYRHLGVPVSVGVGATIDFLAGTFKRAPVWMQRTGTEWIFRMLQEPRRLVKRYTKDLFIFGRAILRQARELGSRPPPPAISEAERIPRVEAAPPAARGVQVRVVPERLDAASAAQVREDWLSALDAGPLILEFVGCRFVDSTGVGLLVRLRKRAREVSRPFLLAGAPDPVVRALELMKLDSFFDRVADVAAGQQQILGRPPNTPPASVLSSQPADAEVLHWHGEVTSATISILAESTEPRLSNVESGRTVTIDLSGVPFADSSGVGFMVRLRKRSWQRGVKVVFISPGPAVANVLRLTKLDEYLLGKKL